MGDREKDNVCHSECGCHNHCHHNEEHSKKDIIKLVFGGVLFMTGLFLGGSIRVIFLLTSYLILGLNIIIKAFKNLVSGKVFDENFLMTIATFGAIAIGEYPEAVGVMLFYRIGDMLEDIAIEKSEKSINNIMDIRPDYAYIEKNSERIKVRAEEVKKGDIIIVSPGERIPVDGKVIKGESVIDTSSLTGESIPRAVREDDAVLGGTINLGGVLYIKTESDFGDSTASKIIDLMRNSMSKKGKSEKFITAFAKRYTPIVVSVAAFVGLVVPLFDGLNFAKWIYSALIFLVVSCPCALVLSVPLSFFASQGAAARRGIVIKGGDVIEKLTKIDNIAFDKTGTLTKGVFLVDKVESKIPQYEFLRILAYSEYYSNHPIALAIKKAYKEKIDPDLISDYKEMPGKGVRVKIDNNEILSGNAAFLRENGVVITNEDKSETTVYMSRNGEYLGFVTVRDEIRDKDSVRKLKEKGYYTVMLTGDNRENAERIGKELDVDKVYSNLLPEDKVSALKSLSGNTLFVGDGINDAPVIAIADVGIAMGMTGQDAAQEAADAVLMDDDLNKLSDAFAIAKKTMRIIKQNIIFSIGIKLAIMIFSLIGIGSIWLAVFADVGVALIAVANSLRTLR